MTLLPQPPTYYYCRYNILPDFLMFVCVAQVLIHLNNRNPESEIEVNLLSDQRSRAAIH